MSQSEAHQQFRQKNTPEEITVGDTSDLGGASIVSVWECWLCFLTPIPTCWPAAELKPREEGSAMHRSGILPSAYVLPQPKKQFRGQKLCGTLGHHLGGQGSVEA